MKEQKPLRRAVFGAVPVASIYWRLCLNSCEPGVFNRVNFIPMDVIFENIIHTLDMNGFLSRFDNKNEN